MSPENVMLQQYKRNDDTDVVTILCDSHAEIPSSNPAAGPVYKIYFLFFVLGASYSYVN